MVIVNNSETVDSILLATVTSIEKALTHVSGKVDVKKDILFLCLTRRGSAKYDLSIDQDGLPLPNLSAKRLAGMLKLTCEAEDRGDFSLLLRWFYSFSRG